MYLRKHYDGDVEYISASDVLIDNNEDDPKIREIFRFLYLVEQELNYFNTHTSTAFGNPDLERIKGMVVGYCIAKGWEIEDTSTHRIIRKGSRVKFKIEKPRIPTYELENRLDIRRTRADLGF